ncbi:N-acetyltransferase 9-like protein [Escovopsis weberi]|uniref:N-acetyltransferase 9-like protein n=1 Tax=Escovopsis weberi TaxID=150374 RepID=A0A0M8MQ76_ESCWE|nr:N-acetyltransferase 9-like protein [Escovopsis weberi]
MKVNEGIAIQTDAVLLVPYEARHVPRYHSWMQDPDIREATASEALTLQEEFENQQSWRRAHDKLTFILCRPPPPPSTPLSRAVAGQHDAEGSMIGDVNFFLYPHDEEPEPDREHGNGDEARNGENGETRQILVRGEVDIMVAETDARGRGVGSAAVRALLAFVARHTGALLEEYAAGERARWVPESSSRSQAQSQGGGADAAGMRLVGLMVKIKESNASSIRLFGALGFVQDGGVDYFGEVKMVLPWDSAQHAGTDGAARLGYRELVYASSV